MRYSKALILRYFTQQQQKIPVITIWPQEKWWCNNNIMSCMCKYYSLPQVVYQAPFWSQRVWLIKKQTCECKTWLVLHNFQRGFFPDANPITPGCSYQAPSRCGAPEPPTCCEQVAATQPVATTPTPTPAAANIPTSMGIGALLLLATIALYWKQYPNIKFCTWQCLDRYLLFIYSI